MKCAILGMIACLTPLVALAECDDVSDDHLNEYDHHHHDHGVNPVRALILRSCVRADHRSPTLLPRRLRGPSWKRSLR